MVRIVDEHGLSAARLGTVAIACAALDDVTAWIVLALVTAFARADTASASASVVGIGVDIGLLPPMLFTMLTLMALVTTAMTSPLLRYMGFGKPPGLVSAV